MLVLTNTSRLITVSWNGTIVRVEGPAIPINRWTHAVVTYSSANGWCLYVNGSLFNASASFSFQASGAPNYMFIASPRTGLNFTLYHFSIKTAVHLSPSPASDIPFSNRNDRCHHALHVYPRSASIFFFSSLVKQELSIAHSNHHAQHSDDLPCSRLECLISSHRLPFV